MTTRIKSEVKSPGTTVISVVKPPVTNVAKTFAKKRTEHVFAEKGTLILSKELLDQIDYLHEKVGNKEWCGILFYKKIEGDIGDPKSLVLKAENIYLMDIGTGAYTDADIEMEDILEMDKLYGTGFKKGLIHTHHNMKAFFSGTDMDELHEETDKHNYYLSLIVNIAGEYVARVAYIAKRKIVTTVEYKDSEDQVQHEENVKDEEILAMIDMNIEWEVEDPQIPDFFRSRYDAIKSKKEQKTKTFYTGYTGGFQDRVWGQPQHSFAGNHYSPPSHLRELNKAPKKADQGDWNEGARTGKLDFPGENSQENSSSSTGKSKKKIAATVGTNGKVVYNSKSYVPLSEIEAKIKEDLIEWLKSGLEMFPDMLPDGSPDRPDAVLTFLSAYFEKNDDNYSFFLQQMGRALEDKFKDRINICNIVSKVGTELLDPFLEVKEVDSVTSDLYCLVDALPSYYRELRKSREQDELEKQILEELESGTGFHQDNYPMD